MPRRKLTARDILDQSGHGQDVFLVRDHGGVHDVMLDDDATVDLADGNVFRTVPRCEAKPNAHCMESAKRAFVCDDEWDVTLVGQQTGRALKRLLGLPADAVLLRDHESPNDRPIADDERVEFQHGPVFTSRTKAGHGITREKPSKRTCILPVRSSRACCFGTSVTLLWLAANFHAL